uniref:Uncharacterized protein n=1 Tax=Anopheles melas TaxID=34690 RepID=A0A182UIH7_9DIPT
MSLISAGSYHYNNHLVPAGPPPPPPPSPPQYLPNYDVVPTDEYVQPVKYHSWGHGPAWTPITSFPWPGPEHEPHYPPHYHAGSATPCPHKMKKYTTTPKTTTTTTTTTTHRPIEDRSQILMIRSCPTVSNLFRGSSKSIPTILCFASWNVASEGRLEG